MSVLGTFANLKELIPQGKNVFMVSIKKGQNNVLSATLTSISTILKISNSEPDQFKQIITYFLSGCIDSARAANTRVLPAIKHKNRQSRFCGASEAMLQVQVMKLAFWCYQITKLLEKTRAELIDQRLLLDEFSLRLVK